MQNISIARVFGGGGSHYLSISPAYHYFAIAAKVFISVTYETILLNTP